MEYIHPSELTAEQRRANSAAILERFARAHEQVALAGYDVAAQLKSAENAKHVARRLRSQNDGR